MKRTIKAARGTAGFTLIETLVTVMIIGFAAAAIGFVLVGGLRSTAATERADESVAATQAIMAKARQVSYSDLGYFSSDSSAPSGVVTLPLGRTTTGSAVVPETKEQAVVLGATRPAGTAPFTVPVDVFSIKAVDYKVTTWVTAVPAIAPDTVSRAKRVTVRTEWAPAGAPLDGACTGASKCAVQSMVRTAAGSDVDPASGTSADASSACHQTDASVCEGYVRSGRVLDGSRMATGNDIPVQSEPVDLYARTNQVATTVTATWSYTVQTATGTDVKNVSKAMTSTDGGTRWTTTVEADPVAENVTPKGDIRPGSVNVTFTAKIAGSNVTTTTPAFWSYTLATGAQSDHITVLPTSTGAGWCVPVGAGAPVTAEVTGHSVGLRTGTVPTSSADTVDFVFTIPDALGAKTVTVPGTLVSATPQLTTINGIELPSSTNAVWTATAPATSDCQLTSSAQVIVHRAVDHTDTVAPLRLSAS